MSEDLNYNIQFCQVVESHKALYDYTRPDYKNRNVHDAIWEQISKQLKESVKDCKERWKNIRNRYSKYIKTKNLPSGSEAKPIKEYYLASHLQFLDQFLKSRTSEGNIRKRKFNEDDQNEHQPKSPQNNSPLSTHSDSVPRYLEQSTSQIPKSQNNKFKKPPTIAEINKTALEYFTERKRKQDNEKKQNSEVDTDMAFLQSVLPDMRAMNGTQKRNFKIGILKLAGDILEGHTSQMPLSLSSSRLDFFSQNNTRPVTPEAVEERGPNSPFTCLNSPNSS